MKLASYRVDGRASWGVVKGTEIVDIGAIPAVPWPDLKAVIEAAAFADIRHYVEKAPKLSQAEIDWLPVIPKPEKIICIGLNYETHRKETGRSEAAYPTIFTRFADSQLGHTNSIIRPSVSTALDYEGELAVVIGKSGRHIKAADALAHVAGYSCYNDATVRDWQRHTHQFTPGKNFPATGAFGPWLTTADEIADVTTLTLTTRLNGTVVQQAGLDQLIFPIQRLIEYCSTFTSLAPGDVIATGTPGGVGFKREPPLFLKPGDQVEVDIPGVGRLTNGIMDE